MAKRASSIKIHGCSHVLDCCRPASGHTVRGVSDRGPASGHTVRGVSDRGHTVRGVSDRGHTVRGVSDRGPAKISHEKT